MHELPLVFFTVLGQTAVGLFTLVWLSNKLGMTTPLQLKQANIVGLILGDGRPVNWHPACWATSAGDKYVTGCWPFANE